MSAVRWTVVVAENVDRALRAYLGRKGMKKGDISRFVEEAVEARLFDLTVRDLKERNRDVPGKELLALIEEAVDDG